MGGVTHGNDGMGTLEYAVIIFIVLMISVVFFRFRDSITGIYDSGTGKVIAMKDTLDEAYNEDEYETVIAEVTDGGIPIGINNWMYCARYKENGKEIYYYFYTRKLINPPSKVLLRRNPDYVPPLNLMMAPRDFVLEFVSTVS